MSRLANFAISSPSPGSTTLPVDKQPLETSSAARRPAAVTAAPVGSTSSLTVKTTDGESSTLRRNLFASTTDGAGYSIMVGMAESYIGPFAIALGFDAAIAGLMVTVPVLLGSVMQLGTPWAVKRSAGHRAWIVVAVALQVACLVALPLASLLLGSYAIAFAYAVASLYWAAGLSTAPSWNTWMGEIIPSRIRTRFFACRQRVSQFCLLFSFAGAGLALEWGRSSGHPLAVFTVIFLVGAVARTVSGFALASTSASRHDHRLEEFVPLWKLFQTRSVGKTASPQSGSESRGGWLVIYLLAMQVGVQLAAPYFAPFMLKQEGMSYITYMLLIGVAILGKALSMPYWGRFGQKYGPRALLWVGGCAIVPLSAFWLVIDHVPSSGVTLPGTWLGMEEPIRISSAAICIACIQPFSGCCWAAYELAVSIMLMHGIPQRQRTSMITWYNFGNSLAMVLGSLLGAYLLRSYGEMRSTYMMIFFLSAAFRFLSIAFLARVK